jgi:hypothetical protein
MGGAESRLDWMVGRQGLRLELASILTNDHCWYAEFKRWILAAKRAEFHSNALPLNGCHRRYTSGGKEIGKKT